MFENLITIHGKHAYYVNKLTKIELNNDKKLSIFERNLDVYLAAPVVGYINGRKEPEEIGNYKDITAKISVEQLVREDKNLEMIFRTIMLLDESKGADEEAEIIRAFKDDSTSEFTERHTENMEVFNSYVRGGISILYEALVANAAVKDDYLKNIYNYAQMFNIEIDGVSDEDLETEVGLR